MEEERSAENAKCAEKQKKRKAENKNVVNWCSCTVITVGELGIQLDAEFSSSVINAHNLLPEL